MTWVIGIDEAGYGPNLGPLLQSAVALRLPGDDPAGWVTLRHAIRQAHEPEDERWLIDDSKKVHAGTRGVEALARGLFLCLPERRLSLTQCLQRVGLPGVLEETAQELWFDGEQVLQVDSRISIEPVSVAIPGVNLVQPTRFNRIVREHGSKAAVLSQGLIELIHSQIRQLPEEEDIEILCDKHGGRNFYAAMLASAFADRWVHPVRESAEESRYRIEEPSRTITVTFRPRADGNSAAVALASMISKYLREVCMGQFNAFWAKQVSGLKPTAGYPVDARRFYAEIQPAMESLGLLADSIWRQK